MDDAKVDASKLVASFGNGSDGWRIIALLQQLGAEALPAVYEGLHHDDWQIRRWCAAYLDRNPSAEVAALVPLLDDAKSAVRVWAVHSLACERCKEAQSAVDVVPLLIDRLRNDRSIRVRRMAVAMLAYGPFDSRVAPVLEEILAQQTDRKLHVHATLGLLRQTAWG